MALSITAAPLTASGSEHWDRRGWSIAAGNVYNLRSLADFEGVYGQVRSGWAAGDQGRGTLWMQNANGVYLRWSVYAAGYH